MDVWVTARVVCHGNAKWTQILTTHKTKEEAEKEAVKIREETGEKIYTGKIIEREIKNVD